MGTRGLLALLVLLVGLLMLNAVLANQNDIEEERLLDAIEEKSENEDDDLDFDADEEEEEEDEDKATKAMKNPFVRRISLRRISLRRISLRRIRIIPPDPLKCLKRMIRYGTSYRGGPNVGVNKFPTRMMSITRDPDRGFFIRHNAGKCVTVDVNNDKLYLHHICQDKFEWMGNKLKHVASGLCIHRPTSNFLMLYNCNAGLRLQRLGSHQNLQATGDKWCIHPQNGHTHPSDGTNLLMHPVCNQLRLRFTIHKVPNDFSSKKERIITIKHTSGKCLSLGSDNKIHLTAACQDFVLDDKNNLKHFATGKCIAPDGGSYLTAYVLCNENTKFKLTNDGYLKNIGLNKCVHPYGGSSNPSEGTKTVVHTSCSGNRIKFSSRYQRYVHLHWLKRIREVRHNRCVIVTSNNRLLLTTSCHTSFIYQGSTSLMHYPSMKCVKPTCNPSYCSVALSNDCDRQSWYENHHGAIKNRWNGRCFNVDGGNFIYLSDSCTRKFNFEALGYSEDVGRHLGSNIYKIVHSGGKCVNTDKFGKLVLKSKCEDLYKVNKNGPLVDLYTGTKFRCTGEICSLNGASTDKFFITTKGELRLVKEKKCLIPYGGSTSPAEETKLVIHQNCGYGAVFFKFVPVEALVKFVFYQKTSKLCFSVDKYNKLILSKYDCSTNFALTQSGSLVHVDSGRCVAPRCGSWDCELFVQQKCDRFTRFKVFNNGLTKNLATGLCLHPKGGKEVPNDGTPVIVHGCDYRPALGYGMRPDGYVEGLILRQTLAWAPKLYFYSKETYFPSSVDYFLKKVRIEPWQPQPSVLTASNFPKITVGKYLETKQRLSTPTNILSFFHGQKPDHHTFPTYNLIKVDGRTTTLRYFLFYPYNKGKNMCLPVTLIKCVCSWFGNHVGDWEHVKFTLKDGKPSKVEISSHNFAMHYYWNRASMVQTGGIKLGNLQVTPEGNVAMFVAGDSHGQYPGPIKYKYRTFAKIFPAIDYCSSNGLSALASNNVKAMVRREHRSYSGTESWRNFKGRWGNIGRHFSWGTNCYGGTIDLKIKKIKLFDKFCRLDLGPTLSD